jgi:hypothetical protein
MHVKRRLCEGPKALYQIGEEQHGRGEMAVTHVDVQIICIPF